MRLLGHSSTTKQQTMTVLKLSVMSCYLASGAATAADVPQCQQLPAVLVAAHCQQGPAIWGEVQGSQGRAVGCDTAGTTSGRPRHHHQQLQQHHHHDTAWPSTA